MFARENRSYSVPKKPTCFLRPYTRSDQEELSALFTDAEVMRYVGDGRPAHAPAVPELMEKILRLYETDPSFLVWAIQEGQEYAGHAELKRRIGRSEYELIYFLQRSRWGRRLGSDVVDLLLSQARNRLIPFVVATVHADNTASIAILKRRGFIIDVRLSSELSCPAYRLVL